MFLLFFSAVMWLIDVVMVAIVMAEKSLCTSSLYIDKWIVWLKKKALVSSAIADQQPPPLGWSLTKVTQSSLSTCASEKLHDQVLMPVASIAPFLDVAFLYFSVKNLLGINFCDLTALRDQYMLEILCAQICAIAAKLEDTIFMSKVIYKRISCLYLLKT